MRWQHIAFPLLIALAGLIIYANTFHVPFNYDDQRFIVENPGVKSLSFNQFQSDNPGTYSKAPSLFGATRQVVFLSFSLNYKLSGLSVAGFHVVNLLIHIINALLVYWLVLLTLKTPFFRNRLNDLSRLEMSIMALFAGLAFVSHPVQTQAVTYISQRFASMATLFYLASILLYIKSRMVSSNKVDGPDNSAWKPARTRILLYAGAIVFAIIAMRSKEISYTLPAVIAIYEFTFFTGNIKKRIINLLPIAGTWLMIPINFLGSSGPISDAIQAARGDTSAITSISYLFTQFRVIVTYLRLFFFPADQNLDYDYPLYSTFSNPNVFLSLILLMSIAGAGFYLFRRSGVKDPLLRLSAFGIFWFFTALAVESSISPSGHLIEEHRLYLPSIGLIIALVGILWAAWERWKERWPRICLVAIPAGLLVLAVLAVMTFERNTVWHDEISLWQDAAAKSPNKVRPHYNLGNYFLRSGSIDRGIRELRRVLEIQPDFTAASNNLGTAYMNFGQYDRAAAVLAEAVALAPDRSSAEYNVGVFLPAFYNLGICYTTLGQYDQAAAMFAEVISLDPNHYLAHYNLGICYEVLGRNSEAVAEFREALKINPGFSQAREKLS